MIPNSSTVLSATLSGEFRWFCNKNIQQLKLGDQVVGSLRKTSFWSSDFQAESTYGSWKFSRRGMLGTGAEILDMATNQCVAAFKSNWGRGMLIFADGETFQINSKGYWRPFWSVRTLDGHLVVSMSSWDSGVELIRRAGMVEGRSVLLAFFLKSHMQQIAEDDGTMAAMLAAT